jgi:multidrug transporter EmrE-like cation transporter
MSWLSFITLLIGLELIADIFSKKYSLSGHLSFWLLALVCYIIASIFWLRAIRLGSGLARGVTIFSVVSVTAAVVIGIIFYKESASKTEIIGITLGVISIILILWN